MPQAVVWIEAAKRLALCYVAVSAGTVATVLSDRVRDTAAAVVVSSHGLLHIVRATLEQLEHELAPEMSRLPELILEDLEHTKAHGDVLLAAEGAAGVERSDSISNGSRAHNWVDAKGLTERALQNLLIRQRDAAPAMELMRPPSQQQQQQEVRWIAALWRLVSPTPVDASYPLFVLYTSGSTGKPKGIVHVHGGYQVGLAETSRTVFNLSPPKIDSAEREVKDRLLVIATPGWITGQSYMIAVALLCAVPSVLLDGSPVSPPDRFAAVIARHRVSILKAGSTFLRMVMTGGAFYPVSSLGYPLTLTHRYGDSV